MSNINTIPATSVEQGPDVVSAIANETAVKIAASGGKLDLRAFQTELYKFQRRERLSAGFRRMVNASRAHHHRVRVRQNVLADCKVVDTAKDSAGKSLYFELSNGQVVSAARVVQKSRNPVLQRIVAAEIEKNALRAA